MKILMIGLAVLQLTMATAAHAGETTPYVPQLAPIELGDIIGTDYHEVALVARTQDPAQRKAAFIAMLMPRLEAVNAEIRADRARILRLRKDAGTRRLTPSGRQDIAAIEAKYKSADWNELLRRANPVPERLAISQAALESGWGTSYLALNALSFFGQARPDGSNAWFQSISESVRAYAFNLCTHPAYAAFREARSAPKAKKPKELASHLEAYSAEKRDYVSKIQHVLASEAVSTAFQQIADAGE